MNYKLPSLAQWKQIFKVLKKGERIALLSFIILAIGSLSFLISHFYISNTNVVPGFGGTYVEGVVGQPRFINPIYGETNDIDRTLIDLTFSGLQTYDKDGNIINDLAESYTISEDGKTYTFNLKKNVTWSDGYPLTTDDVIFTIKTIQNSDYKSPLRANWVDVDAEKLSNTSFSFILKQPYNSFLENCTVKIIPQHIWQNISPENFILSIYNIQPVGSGPFKFKSLNQTNAGFITDLNLVSNRQYYNSPSFISTLSFKFFETTQDVIQAANNREVNGFAAADSNQTATNLQKQIGQGWPNQDTFNSYSFSLPRYFAVFFNNQKTSVFSDPTIRQALSHAVDKKELVQNIATATQTDISQVDSPILPEFYGYQTPTNVLAFNTAKANELLDKAGFKKNGQGERVKTTTKKPAFQFKSYLRLGSKGTEVTQLQACLTKLPSAVRNSLNGNFATILQGETSGSYGKPTENAVNEFQKEYLPNLPPTGEVGASTRQKLNELCASSAPNVQELNFTLVTIDQPQLVQVANSLKQYWATVGVTVDINAVSITDLKPIIKNRDYDMLLYGETLGMQPDLYPFWYSSQKQDPGLNLSLYENKDVDTLLKNSRQTKNPDQKKQDLEKIQTPIINDAAALFLYNPHYTYWASAKVSGLQNAKIADPAKRFVNITSWYLKTKRTWK